MLCFLLNQQNMLFQEVQEEKLHSKGRTGCASAMAQQKTTGEENSSLSESQCSGHEQSWEAQERGVQAGGFWEALSCSPCSSAHSVVLPNPPRLPFSEVTGSQSKGEKKALSLCPPHIIQSMCSAAQSLVWEAQDGVWELCRGECPGAGFLGSAAVEACGDPMPMDPIPWAQPSG